MDWLYRFFYTIISLGILMVVLLPLVAALRFLLRNYKKKYMLWGWRIFYLRSICPVALSSAFCLTPVWNRSYHLFLTNLGLSIEDNSGIMRSWRAVFENEVSATPAFKICSIIWAVGVIGALLMALGYQRRLKKQLKGAKRLGENIYESEQINVPVWFGMFHKKIYLPQGFQTQEIAWLLRHVEAHRLAAIKRILVGVITVIHWCNPVMWLYYYWWKHDEEMAADEQTVYGKGMASCKEYAQSILNFNKDFNVTAGKNRKVDKAAILFSGIIEGNTEKRAYRMLYQKRDRTSDKFVVLLLLSLVLIFCFFLTPMKIAWSGGTWGNGNSNKKSDLMFQAEDTTVVAEAKTTSPEGLERVIQLEMLSGEKTKEGYEGNFVIKMYGLVGDEIASSKVSEIFPEIENGKQKFLKGVTLCINDYNGDDIQELVIGQQIKMSQDELRQTVSGDKKETAEVKTEDYNVYSYALVNLEDQSLKVICNDITAIATKTELGESVFFERPEKIEDIFMVPEGENVVYYVWNDNNKTYEKREMSEEELEAHRENAEQISSNDIEEHTLENADGKVIVLVSTKQDSTGSKAIQSVTLYPRDASKKFKDIKGYYCDLLWVPDKEEDEEERYAQLIYNGTKSQTFVIYDTKQKTMYYQHEDGTEQLAAVFKQYKEEDISFEENDAVIYSLAEKNGDMLKINFAAEADNAVTVKGSYCYDVVKRQVSNLTFNRTVAEDTDETQAPQGTE